MTPPVAEPALLDPVTGLPGALLFRDRLAQRVEAAALGGSPGALLVLEVAAADGRMPTPPALAREAGRRLRDAAPRTASVCHIGAATFALLLANAGDPGSVAALVEQVVMPALTAPVPVDGHDVALAAPVGIALFPADGADAERLLQIAEDARRRAVARGVRYLFARGESDARISERRAFEDRLRDALADEEFVLHYQPKVELATGRIVGAEALVRWQHPELGLLPPDRFLPAIEGGGLAIELSAWALRSACARLCAWQAAGHPATSVSVNLSSRQFADASLVARVEGALREFALDPRVLELELTENIVMHDAERFGEKLHALKALGVRLSLDDFGTGYSSLRYLKRFPLDRLKIDQSFVADITTNPDDAAIVRAVISLGHSLELELVAEGVETDAQVSWLRRERCDQIQGYFFSEPVPAADFERMLAQRKSLFAAPARAGDERRTLLIVDDEPNIVSSLVRLLRSEDYRVLTAGNARDALELLALNRVQVIISDHRMPVMTGAEFLAKVKTLYPDIVRILFSGYIEMDALTEAVNRGAVYRFLLKPWDDDVLRDAVRDAFRHHWHTSTETFATPPAAPPA
ncbi:MAG: EAL domain-containing protein [Burkholderiales bacterium]